jgi:hypothetical protein
MDAPLGHLFQLRNLSQSNTMEKINHGDISFIVAEMLSQLHSMVSRLLDHQRASQLTTSQPSQQVFSQPSQLTLSQPSQHSQHSINQPSPLEINQPSQQSFSQQIPNQPSQQTFSEPSPQPLIQAGQQSVSLPGVPPHIWFINGAANVELTNNNAGSTTAGPAGSSYYQLTNQQRDLYLLTNENKDRNLDYEDSQPLGQVIFLYHKCMVIRTPTQKLYDFGVTKFGEK